MRVTNIEVIAGRTFNHPYESYSNLRPEVKLVAQLDMDEDPKLAAKALQAQAEELVEDHKGLMLAQLEQLYQLTQAQAQARSLGAELAKAQRQMEELREKFPAAFPQLTQG